MTVSAESASVAELLLVLVTAMGGGVIAFLLVYWLWLRRFARRVIDLQDTVFSLASAFSRKRKPAADAGGETLFSADYGPASSSPAQPEAPAEAQGYRMLLEGRDIEIVSAEGREEIRIEETPERPLSPQERDRIIAYLRNEGFLP